MTELLRGTSLVVGGVNLRPRRLCLFSSLGSDPFGVSHLNKGGLRTPGGRRFQPKLGRPGAGPADPSPWSAPGPVLLLLPSGSLMAGAAVLPRVLMLGWPGSGAIALRTCSRSGLGHTPAVRAESGFVARASSRPPSRSQVPRQRPCRYGARGFPARSPALSRRGRTGAGAMARRWRTRRRTRFYTGFFFRRGPRPRAPPPAGPEVPLRSPRRALGPSLSRRPSLPAPLAPRSECAVPEVREALSPTSARSRLGTAGARGQGGEPGPGSGRVRGRGTRPLSLSPFPESPLALWERRWGRPLPAQCPSAEGPTSRRVGTNTPALGPSSPPGSLTQTLALKNRFNF